MSTLEEQFTALWHTEAPRVLAYATRHVGAESAQDVVAETFMIAWRRYAEVPTPPIGWLLVTARLVMRNRARSVRRLRALEDRIALLDSVAAHVADASDAALTRREALERLGRLDEKHREALLLVSWDGLSADEAAAVLGVKAATFRKRLSRARELLDRTESPPGAGVPARPVRPSAVPQETS